ncbi:MAG: hypothetical protein CV087_10080 [Candidatus Brocadia sp. WS118]|nr:MAG: hypothetical protein CV087_10080 [Candidatus Brocadia sp. WS118]
MNRYLDIRVYQSLVRTHNTTSAIASLVSAFQYLFRESYSPEVFIKIVGKVIKNPSSDIFIHWAEIIAAFLGKKIYGDVFFRGGWKREEASNDNNWESIRKLLCDEDCFLILNYEGHLTPMMGFGAFPYNHQSFENNENRWLIQAETLPWHSKSSVPELHMSLSPPIFCMRWEVVRKCLFENVQNGMICISKV